MLEFLKILALFVVTALAEIIGCYLPWLVLTQGRPRWLLIPAAVSLALFAWLLTLHPGAAGRIYAAYGGVYVAIALLWLWQIDGIPITRWDLVGSAVALAGMAIIMLQPVRSV
ncbi:MAG: YnfA family protein [Azonexus sp.]